MNRWQGLRLIDGNCQTVLSPGVYAYEAVLHSFSKKVQREVSRVNEIQIRPMRREQYPLLEDFFYDAIFQPEESEPLPRDVIQQPELAVYIRDFGKQDDMCLVAESEGKVLGAVWTRILAGEIKGYGYIDESTPEVAISVKKEFRRQGIGKKLMQEMLIVLKSQGYERVSLSVDKENYACRMYEALGFRIMEEQKDDYLLLLQL